ncbi:5' nucleotidase, deoxy (Pyrimidine), cytosolic type C protein [Snodgrassella alvi SCGC AB-598-O02]|nr:5' nucleotidase, deoxy (Pyrimidine), cytosolic type C protein [Snodgrassella alvi SCGC AB-598-O02]
MTKKLILLDQDGVLADFEHGVRQLWQQTYQQPLPLAERKHFYLRDDMPAQFHQQLAQIYSSKGFFCLYSAYGRWNCRCQTITASRS